MKDKLSRILFISAALTMVGIALIVFTPVFSKGRSNASPEWKKGLEGATELPSPIDKEKANVLIVTGVDIPNHGWKATAPALKKAIEQDDRMEVAITNNPHHLASEKLHEYDVVVIHFMPNKDPSPGEEARSNFKKFVNDGGGVVVVHFACAAWMDWPEYVKISGRVWEKGKAHDPKRSFTVEIKDKEHPITKDMKPFNVNDELYTCLTGDTEITIIAEAQSIVDKKMHPVAFVLNYGKGRIFHSPLGHWTKTFESEGANELFRRGSAWAAGLDL